MIFFLQPSLNFPLACSNLEVFTLVPVTRWDSLDLGLAHHKAEIELHNTGKRGDTYRSFKPIFLFFIVLSGVRLSSLGSVATTGLLYQSLMIDDSDCGAIGAMKIGKENRSTRRKLAPEPP
jgi:hypothetical protein